MNPDVASISANLIALDDRQRDSEARLRAVEAAVIQLTEISRQLKESAQDRETRLRALEKTANVEHHDEDHEARLKRLEELWAKRNADEGGKPKAAIVANLSARELVFIGVAFAGFITGKWEWLTGLFK